jgi:predicted N-acetyltransferase YhbS
MHNAAITRPVITSHVTAADIPAISALHKTVFGPGRFVRSAYRVREGKGSHSRFCRLARIDERVIAALRLTPVTIGGDAGAVLLGPIAVDPEFAGNGFGRRLITEALDEMRSAGVSLVILVGDEPYYGRLGFKPVTAGQIAFPGPVNPARILGCELADGALGRYRGLVAAAGQET